MLKNILEDKNPILDKVIKNPETGRDVKVSTALGYSDDKPVKKKAEQLIKKDKKKDSRSHKETARKFVPNEKLHKEIAKKGIEINIQVPDFIKEVTYNKKYNEKTKDKTWSYKVQIPNKLNKLEWKYNYSTVYQANAKLNKDSRVANISDKDINILQSKLKKHLTHKDSKVRQCAIITSMIEKSGQRVGSNNETINGSVGMRTLRVEHIKIKGDVIDLAFLGKSSQDNYTTIKDKELSEALKKQIGNKKPNDNIFDVSYNLTTKYYNEVKPKNSKSIKDLRTIKANQIGRQELNRTDIPPLPMSGDTKKDTINIKDKLKNAFEVTAGVLNNTVQVTKDSYVSTSVILEWLDNLGVTPKQVGYGGKIIDKIISEENLENNNMKEKIETKEFNPSLDYFRKNYIQKDIKNTMTDEELEEDECDTFGDFSWLLNDNIEFVPKEK